ncbi:MAG TPA: carboxypeptidase-like regulatory domain-containing protein [Longimicrobiaceae bacterium]|jgi:hypothetical protein|nr:carboxypeptidase-like regulatory domain-containing protein [Longimicrobiaceae bacterium]
MIRLPMRCGNAPGLALAAAMLAWGAPAAAAQRGVVAGTVVDSATGQPLHPAHVTLDGSGRWTATDRAGRFVLSGVAAGTHRAAVEMLGYAEDSLTWAVGAGDTLRVRVVLAPSAIELAAIMVQVDKLERRMRVAGWSARTAAQRELANSATHDAARFVTDHFGMQRAPCAPLHPAPQASRRQPMQPTLQPSSPFSGSNCVQVRGSVTNVCVLIDEMPASGLDALETYRPEDFYRIEVYRGGALVEAYTHWYVRSMANHPWVPVPVDVQWDSFCRSRLQPST